MAVVTYPKAEQFANSIKIPVVKDSEAFELYGVVDLVLDTAEAKRLMAKQMDTYFLEEAVQTCVLQILEARLETLKMM